MAASDPQRGPITSINVTPLVDITLVLLIIFMVTARVVVNRQALDLDLPKAATGNPVQEIFSVALPADGGIEINGERVRTDDDLVTRARLARARHRELRAVVHADARVPHGRVMRALDLLRQSGVEKIGFGVVPVPQTERAR
ncbi:MAG TPA: biopolymer transporter ExbD [Polyangiaceae bacterium]